jgi:hypothetical protein
MRLWQSGSAATRRPGARSQTPSRRDRSPRSERTIPRLPPSRDASNGGGPRAGRVSRWDPDCDRDHAYLASAPADEPVVQDQTINALAAIGFASCPSAPSARGLVTPIVNERNVLRWPVWPIPIRLADLEAALCCGWSWPTMEARRWHAGELIRFSRGELREPKASSAFS